MKAPLLRHHRSTFYAFDGKKYIAQTDMDIRHQIIEFAKQSDELATRISPMFAKNVLGVLEGICHLDSTLDIHSWIGDGTVKARDMIVLDNGGLNIRKAMEGEQDTLQPHTPDLFTTIALPYSYRANADCPLWQAFLEEVLPEPQCRRLLQQWFGYCLTADCSRHSFLLMTGKGANGKSVVCKILLELLGNANVSSVPLERFGGRFDVFQMYGKLANIVSEIGDLDKADEGLLKSLVAGDPVTFEQKHKSTFTAYPTARLVFATNTLPRFSDRSEGLWRRLLLLGFDVVIPIERQDRGLSHKLMDELPGILNWAICGLRDLNESGSFTEPTKSVEAKEQYRLDVNSARAFLREEVTTDPGNEIETQVLYQSYMEWCKGRNYRPFGENIFGKELKNLFPGVEKQLRRSAANPKRHRVYVGISLIEPNPGYSLF